MKRIAMAAATLALASVGTGTATAEPWSRGYVVEWIEAAAYFGGKGGITGPGTDCPKGTTEFDLKRLLTTSYRPAEEVAKILNPDKPESKGLFPAMHMRGPNKEDVYKEPKSVPDPGMREVQGKIAYGFDLDGNPNTGFTSPTGQRGIDNQFYKAWGCWEAFRGPTRSPGATYHNDEMRNGKFTVAMLISGNSDPRNDEDVTLGIFTSKDKLVKDAKGDIAPDYSFRIANEPRYTSLLKARIVDGVLELKEPQDIKMREASFLATLTLYGGRVRIEMPEEGPIHGMVGGYKPIQEAFTTWTIAGPNVELVTHVDLSAAYYALERNADARPDPENGANTAVSTALHFWAVPAFVIHPKAGEGAQAVSAGGSTAGGGR
ncbi:MAG: hypothetical protein SGJ21_15430 [Alphaproteobacteria bacterium]|nr:hypothetical protein [Alphaproteobacteria bacterium]